MNTYERVREEIARIIDKAMAAEIVDGRFSSKPYADQILNHSNIAVLDDDQSLPPTPFILQDMLPCWKKTVEKEV